MKQTQKDAIALVRRFQTGLVSDAIFSLMNVGKHPYQGEPITSEQAFFKTTELGIKFTSDKVIDWEDYKSLIASQRNMSLTVAMWKEDLDLGMLTHEELVEDGFGDIAAKLCKEIGKLPFWYSEQGKNETKEDMKSHFREKGIVALAVINRLYETP